MSGKISVITYAVNLVICLYLFGLGDIDIPAGRVIDVNWNNEQ